MTLTFAFLQEYGSSDQPTLWWRGFVTQQIVYAVIFYPVSCKEKFSQMWDFMAATFYTNAANKSWSSWALIVYIRRKKGTKLTASVHSQSKSEQICLNFVIPPQTDDAPDINILIWRLYSKAIIQSAFCTYVSEIYFYTFLILKEQQKLKKHDTKPGNKICFNISRLPLPDSRCHTPDWSPGGFPLFVSLAEGKQRTKLWFKVVLQLHSS